MGTTGPVWRRGPPGSRPDVARPELDPNIVPPRGSTDSFQGGSDQASEDQLAEAIQVASQPQTVPVNMYETDEAIVIVAPLPGVMASDIEITVERDRVRIWAEARSLAPKAYLRHEWHYGPYERVVDLPEGFEGEPNASYGNGQLAFSIGRGGSRTEILLIQPAG
ncbi:MAG: hypothetical protein NVS3B12_01070 [Acidimicrobiales bacterium]